MDMDIEVDKFKEKQRPSLIGSSVRNSSDSVPTTKVNHPKQQIFKNNDSHADISNAEDMRAEGALVANEDEQLDSILDSSGHVKDDALPDNIKLKSSTLKTSIDASEVNKLNLEEDQIDDGAKVTILGGDADNYIAPASGSASVFKYKSKSMNGSDVSNNENPSVDFISSDQVRSVDDIINVVNKGDFEKASTLIDHKVAEEVCSSTRKLSLDKLSETSDPIIPTSAINVDAEYTAPAAMREGTESVLLEEQQSRSRSRYGTSPSSDNHRSGNRPSLARGDSIHSGLHDDLSITRSFDQSSKSVVSERKPRHDPTAPRIANTSSLNYLRSISRSRSRMANDRKALGGDERLESNELRETGALINDDGMSNASDIEYAVNKALDLVEDTHTVKSGKKIAKNNDIVKSLQKGLADVQEEDIKNGSNRTTVNTDDLLDQLANSAMELMGDDDDDEEEGEEKEQEENENQGKEEIDDTKPITKVISAIPEEGEADIKNAPNVVEADEQKEIENNNDSEEKESETPLIEENENIDVKNGKDQIFEGEEVSETPLIASDEKESVEKLDQTEKADEVEKEEEEKISETPLVIEDDADRKEVTEGDEKEQVSETPFVIEDDAEKKVVTEDEEEEKISETPLIESDEIIEKQEEVDEETSKEKQNSAAGITDESKENNIDESTESGEAAKSTTTTASSEDVKETNDEEMETAIEDNEKSEDAATETTPENEDEKEDKIITDDSPELKEEPTTPEVDEEPVNKPSANEEDDIDILLAAAEKETNIGANKGIDGSVYVPKASKMTFEDEPVYLYTSFAGGFQVATRTNRLITILTANRIKFEYRDLGTDEEAKKVWRRYSNGKTLPGIVRGKDDYIGNWEDIEEANEDYKVRSLIYETY